jgi:predicted DNA-binding transcriptional regulator YafY
MATNKHALIRFKALDKCFRNTGRQYFMEDLIEACSQAIYDYSGIRTSVSRRQIFDDITYMESEDGYRIELDRLKSGKKVYYRYNDPNFSIDNLPLNTKEEQQLKEALLTLSRFKGMQQFDWIQEIIAKLDSGLNLSHNEDSFIEFEQNKYLKGLEFFSAFYEAIANRKCLKIKYTSFKSPNQIELLFHPYYMKQFNNRWFVFGRNDEYGTIQNLAIDRVDALEITDQKYIANEEIDFTEYLEDVIGVTIPQNATIETIKLEISNDLFPYIQTKPIHESQVVKHRGEDKTIVWLKLIPNYELISLLLSYRDKLKVTEPESFKQEIKEIVNKLHANYLL